jgi:hypothetical protein
MHNIAYTTQHAHIHIITCTPNMCVRTLTAYHSQHTMRSIPCTAYHAQHTMHSIPCTAYHAQHTMRSIPCTAYHAQHTMHSIPCTAYHTQHTKHSTPCTAYQKVKIFFGLHLRYHHNFHFSQLFYYSTNFNPNLLFEGEVCCQHV